MWTFDPVSSSKIAQLEIKVFVLVWFYFLFGLTYNCEQSIILPIIFIPKFPASLRRNFRIHWFHSTQLIPKICTYNVLRKIFSGINQVKSWIILLKINPSPKNIIFFKKSLLCLTHINKKIIDNKSHSLEYEIFDFLNLNFTYPAISLFLLTHQ